jgi:hypothetical protein
MCYANLLPSLTTWICLVGKSGNKQIQGFNWSGLERKIKVFFIKIIFFIFFLK